MWQGSSRALWSHVRKKQSTACWELSQTAAAAKVESHPLCPLTYVHYDLSIGIWIDSRCWYAGEAQRGDLTWPKVNLWRFHARGLATVDLLTSQHFIIIIFQVLDGVLGVHDHSFYSLAPHPDPHRQNCIHALTQSLTHTFTHWPACSLTQRMSFECMPTSGSLTVEMPETCGITPHHCLNSW